jgi:capsular exopolysaccharide synthesis family protein
VLVVSADLRRPALHVCFEREAGIGLADVLMGEATLEDAIERVSPNLWLLTSGRPPARPAELLQSQRLSELLTNAAKDFDFVLVDCRRSAGLADALAVAPFADAVILVARAESTKRSAIVHAAEQLEQVGARVRGAVLNDVTLSKRNADGYGYGYGEDELAKPADGRRGRVSDQEPPPVHPTTPEDESLRRRPSRRLPRPQALASNRDRRPPGGAGAAPRVLVRRAPHTAVQPAPVVGALRSHVGHVRQKPARVLLEGERTVLGVPPTTRNVWNLLRNTLARVAARAADATRPHRLDRRRGSLPVLLVGKLFGARTVTSRCSTGSTRGR